MRPNLSNWWKQKYENSHCTSNSDLLMLLLLACLRQYRNSLVIKSVNFWCSRSTIICPKVRFVLSISLIRINILQASLKMIFNFPNSQPRQILRWFLILTQMWEYQGKTAFNCTTARSEPEPDSLIILTFIRFEPYDSYKKNSLKKMRVQVIGCNQVHRLIVLSDM